MIASLTPARQVLTAAAETNERLGNENLGFLSESHGFMPCEPPLLRLPPSHQAWDGVAAELPELFRSLTLREAFDRMPVLNAEDADLPERYLLRASAMVSIFAHAYHYVQSDPPERMPESILRPWEQITRRLQRPAPHLSFIDLNVYNWKLVDPHRPDPMRAENLDLLIAILGNEDERRFQTVPIEMLAQFTPVVGAIVRAQEAVARDDAAALKVELIAITDALMGQAYVSLMKVNPNAYSKLYVNPVVWGKTVAPLATPYQLDPPPGPSGTAIPAYQLLDTFFGRRNYRSNIGHETARVRQWFPPRWQQFLAAVERISVPEYVSRQGSTTLKGLFREAVNAYAGDTGLLGRHRLKTFGFLDLSFKAGRSKTLGGFGGSFDDRLWDKMDSELDLARLERYTGSLRAYHHVTVKRSERLYSDAAGSIRQVVLDVGDTGIRYQPGDRCAILPENGDELVERTLRALRARGDEPIQLNTVWRQAVQLHYGYAGAKILSLRTLLTFGRIRPVARAIAKALYTLTHNETLRRIIEARAEDQWELWALLEMLAEKGFNPRSLWKAHPGEHESICWIVPPESFRMYSISSAMEEPSAESASELHLTIGRLEYRTRGTDVSPDATSLGTSSSFLARVTDMPADGERRIAIKLVHPPRFSLPNDPAKPIVMFAGGTGLAPFRGLLQERARQAGAGENWLFFATRTRAELFYQDELSRMVAQGQLNLRVAFSQDDVDVRAADGGQLIFEPGSRRYIDAEILRDEHARRLWELLQSEEDGGLGAYIYICGRTGVAGSVMRAIKALLYRYAEGSEVERQERARQTVFRLVGEDRYMQEIFTTYAGPQFEQRNTYDASEVVCHNNEQDGYWMIISGRVYDLTEFAHLHPGGLKIIRSYAGMDATSAYQKVLHDVNSDVDAMLDLYEIGAVRRLDFGSAWNVVISPTGLRFVTLKDVYRAWIGLLYTVVEMENALHNDYGVRHEPVTYDENGATICQSPYKTQLLLQTHQRFKREYLAKLTGEPLQQLWAITSGLHSEGEDVRWMEQRIAAIQQRPAARGVGRLREEIAARLKGLADAGAVPAPQALEWCIDACSVLEEEDKRFMRDMKLALRTGVQVFERLASATIARGSGELIAAAQALPKILEAYYERVVEGVPLSYRRAYEPEQTPG